VHHPSSDKDPAHGILDKKAPSRHRRVCVNGTPPGARAARAIQPTILNPPTSATKAPRRHLPRAPDEHTWPPVRVHLSPASACTSVSATRIAAASHRHRTHTHKHTHTHTHTHTYGAGRTFMLRRFSTSPWSHISSSRRSDHLMCTSFGAYRCPMSATCAHAPPHTMHHTIPHTPSVTM
jgi:hypothetical protein